MMNKLKTLSQFVTLVDKSPLPMSARYMRIVRYSKFLNQKITIWLLKNTLEDYLYKKVKRFTGKYEVCIYFGYYKYFVKRKRLETKPDKHGNFKYWDGIETLEDLAYVTGGIINIKY